MDTFLSFCVVHFHLLSSFLVAFGQFVFKLAILLNCFFGTSLFQFN
uniref:Uncharacterized protein n=1 Tax=Rhizophora mucronata TaxID=61149 RepID=A0A2P2PKG1_RHIMU